MKFSNALILAGLSALLIVLYLFDPSTEAFFPPCPTNALTNLYCPGCGTLRALHALVHGNIAEAASQNILAVILLPLVPIMMLFPSIFRIPFISLFILLAFVLFTVLRNIDKFSFLAPH